MPHDRVDIDKSKDVKYKILQLKAQIFDYIVEIESHQVHINSIIGRKDALLVELDKLKDD